MAAALAVVFAGSYMSCVVQRELDTRTYELSEDKKEVAQNSTQHVCVTSSSYNTSADLKQTSLSVAESTSPPQTTVVSSVTSVTTDVTTAPVTEPVTLSPVVPPPEPPAPPAPQSGNQQGAVPQSAAVGSEYFNDCAFLGDSHIKGMSGYGIVSNSRVFAENGLSLAHINEKISIDSIKAINPKHIYIMMGTNGVTWMKFSDMIYYYKNFVSTLKQSIPDADIYILSIPPVSSDRESRNDNGKMLNSDIDGYNAELLKMALDNGWYYLDVNSALKDGNGYLSGSTDGIHMPRDLYNTFTNYILTHIAN